MSVEASVVYSLSSETGFAAEMCKIALERAKNDATTARRLLERWHPKNKSNNEQEDTPKVYGLVRTYFEKEFNAAAIVEIKCTDELYAKSSEFSKMADSAVEEIVQYEEPYILQAGLPNIENVHKCKITISSNRFNRSNELSLLTTYTHHDNIGVIVETQVDNTDAFDSKQFRLFSFDCALHIAAFNPIAVSPNDIPPDLQSEIKQRIEKQLMADNKPIQLWRLATESKMEKWTKQRSLLNQIFIRSDAYLVDDIRKKIAEQINSDIRITRFSRVELGS